MIVGVYSDACLKSNSATWVCFKEDPAYWQSNHQCAWHLKAAVGPSDVRMHRLNPTKLHGVAPQKTGSKYCIICCYPKYKTQKMLQMHRVVVYWGQVTVVPVFNYLQTTGDVWEIGGTAPHIPGTGWNWVVNYMNCCYCENLDYN